MSPQHERVGRRTALVICAHLPIQEHFSVITAGLFLDSCEPCLHSTLTLCYRLLRFRFKRPFQFFVWVYKNDIVTVSYVAKLHAVVDKLYCNVKENGKEGCLCSHILWLQTGTNIRCLVLTFSYYLKSLLLFGMHNPVFCLVLVKEGMWETFSASLH